MKKQPLIYIASPYSDPCNKVVRERVKQIQTITAEIINNQNAIIPFSPIAYTHQLDALCPDHDWYNWDLQFLRRCDAMIVVKIPGWEQSAGIKKELNYCFENSIPYAYAYPDDILLVCRQLSEILKET